MAVDRVARPAAISASPTMAPARLAAKKPMTTYHGPIQPRARPSTAARRTAPKPAPGGRAGGGEETRRNPGAHARGPPPEPVPLAGGRRRGDQTGSHEEQ